MNKKRSIIIFIILLISMLLYLNSVFSIRDHSKCDEVFNAYYAQKNDTVDVLHLGSSATSRYVIPPVLYEEDGIAMYLLATDGQPFAITRYLIKEGLKSQDPELIIIELRNISVASDEKMPEGLGEDRVRRVVDSMRFSQNRTDTIDEALRNAKANNFEIDYNRWDYILSFAKYHSRWSQDLSWEDFIYLNPKTPYGGFVLNNNTYKTIDPDPCEFTDSASSLTAEQLRVMKELLDYCDTLDCQVLFVASPYMISQEDQQCINAAQLMAEERGYTVLNFNNEQSFEDMDLNVYGDFYNKRHVNMRGAYKYTRCLGRYLNSHYELADRRNDDRYFYWQEGYEAFIRVTEDKYLETFEVK